MVAYLLRRLLALPLVLFGVTVLLEGLVQLLPPAARAVAFIHSERQLAQINQIIQHYGLDKPFPVQYWNWLKAVLHGNLGWSTSVSMPVSQAIATYFPATAELAAYSYILHLGFWDLARGAGRYAPRPVCRPCHPGPLDPRLVAARLPAGHMVAADVLRLLRLVPARQA